MSSNKYVIFIRDSNTNLKLNLNINIMIVLSEYEHDVAWAKIKILFFKFRSIFLYKLYYKILHIFKDEKKLV